MDWIINIDIALFYFFNLSIANSLFDGVMPFITEETNWFITYVLFLGWLIWKGGKRGRIAVIVLLITIAIVDQLNSSVLKDIFGRIRPCRSLDDVRLLVHCGKGKSFPSSHAANSFAAAAVLSTFFYKYKYALYIIAALIGFSRIYVGVHYPFDVIAGACVGLIIGISLAQITKQIFKVD